MRTAIQHAQAYASAEITFLAGSIQNVSAKVMNIIFIGHVLSVPCFSTDIPYGSGTDSYHCMLCPYSRLFALITLPVESTPVSVRWLGWVTHVTGHDSYPRPRMRLSGLLTPMLLPPLSSLAMLLYYIFLFWKKGLRVVTSGEWRVTGDGWRVTGDKWQVISDKW